MSQKVDERVKLAMINMCPSIKIQLEINGPGVLISKITPSSLEQLDLVG